MAVKKKSLGFVGAGNMAGAIIKGMSRAAAAVPVKQVRAYDVRRERLRELKEEYGVSSAASAAELCDKSDVIVLAVKPQQINGVLKEIAPVVDQEKLLISIAAGVSLFQIESRLRKRARLIRVMPNTPLLVGMGMSAMSCGMSVLDEDRAFVIGVFGSVGRIIEVNEQLMDAVTALSGSGPAYVYSLIEGLADGGVLTGLPRAEARLLAAQTVAGAARMVLETGLHPGELKDMVTSPGGTTIHGLSILEKAGFRGILMDAVEAACLRSRKLGEETA